ncbi:MAG: hypothetical protein U1E11_03815 [Dethiobacteria bacterium]|nr:hypothetical protein [Dethiobacteria bacterium]
MRSSIAPIEKQNPIFSIGELELFGEQQSGIGGLSLRRLVEVEGSTATVQIEIKLGLGDLNVSYLPAVPGLSR